MCQRRVVHALPGGFEAEAEAARRGPEGRGRGQHPVPKVVRPGAEPEAAASSRGEDQALLGAPARPSASCLEPNSLRRSRARWKKLPDSCGGGGLRSAARGVCSRHARRTPNRPSAHPTPGRGCQPLRRPSCSAPRRTHSVSVLRRASFAPPSRCRPRPPSAAGSGWVESSTRHAGVVPPAMRGNRPVLVPRTSTSFALHKERRRS